MFTLIFLKNNYNLIVKNILKNINFKLFSFVALLAFYSISLFFSALNLTYTKKSKI